MAKEGNTYQCIEVFSDSQHPLSKYVEDDSDMFILEGGTSNWWKAEDFFHSKGEFYFKEVIVE